MEMCSGTFVPYEELVSCLSGGPCFGEGLAGNFGPACGAMGLPFCPAPQPCGRPGAPLTIACFPPAPVWAPACGAPPFPPCIQPQNCGLPGTFPCAGGDDDWFPIEFFDEEFEDFQTLDPTFAVTIPGDSDFSPAAERLGLFFASPSIPDEAALQSCYDQSATEEDFFSCITQEALPDDYRQVASCIEEHSDDAGAAALCSIGNEDALEAYQKFSEVQACMETEGDDEFAIAGCLGDQFLGEDERYYLRCVTDNQGELEVAAVCAVAKDLNPEQQIALACAVQTGGNPKAFAICTAGRLTARELSKCWDGGIATDDGCFGPNNELRRAARFARDQICAATGENSAVCESYSWWQDNVMMPGPNHEAVRHLNNAISDIRNGPGENNEIVKAGRAVEGVFQSVGSAIGGLF